MSDFVISIDQGTTSTRALIFDENQSVIAFAQKEFAQHYPEPGWVEHDPEEIWQSVLDTVREAMEKAELSAHDIAALGITNQRETVIVWDRETGKPIQNAIVWQDRRTAKLCETLKLAGKEKLVTKKTGLVLDPYFSGSKLRWLAENRPGFRELARKGRLAFGTVDSFLIWQMSGGEVHATDITNASRTLLFDIENEAWDDELLELFRVDHQILPEVKESADNYGMTAPEIFGAPIAIRGVAGDQHAATIGQACFQPGMIKSTYGTGCFVMMNTGDDLVRSRNRLLTTIAYKVNGKTAYALEGSIFIAGAAVQWLRDGIKIIETAKQTGELAQAADPEQDVFLVPAFVGLGAPYWDAKARGAIFGLTQNTGPNEFARAALESVCFQTKDLMDAMKKDAKEIGFDKLRVDGGMSASDWTMQFLADMVDIEVDRPKVMEATALGAAWLAASHIGVWSNARRFADTWELDRTFSPQIDRKLRNKKLAGWKDAVARTLTRP